MTKTKYIIRRNDEIIGSRRTDRVYSHAIAIWGHGLTAKVTAWCGRPDLAQARARELQRSGFTTEILPTEIAPRKEPRT